MSSIITAQPVSQPKTSSLPTHEHTSTDNRRWQYWALIGALSGAFLWFCACAAFKCRCEESVWHESQAKAGLVFVGIVFLRLVFAAIIRDRCFKWHIYLILCLTSPLWIRAVFDL